VSNRSVEKRRVEAVASEIYTAVVDEPHRVRGNIIIGRELADERYNILLLLLLLC